jgi:hypothetical protein
MTERLGLPFLDWPSTWQIAWEGAITPSDSLFSDQAAVSDLRPDTLDIREEALSMYLGFIKRNRLTDPSVALESDGDPSAWHIQAYVDEQRARGVCNTTLYLRVQALTHALRMMWPGMDFRWLQRPGGRSLRAVLPCRPRKVEVRDHRELLQRALDLHAEGLTGKGYAGGKIALRDAAIIALLSWQGTRVRALTEMKQGTSLFYRGGRYWVAFGADNTKMHHTYEIPLPAILNQVFHDYLAIARPLLGGHASDALWMSISHGPLTYRGITEIARSRTLEWFGKERGPHWFRKCITTTVRLVAPELALDAAIVMDHSLVVAQEHYNMAKGVAAALRHEHRMDQRMAETADRADSVFRRQMEQSEYKEFRLKQKHYW